jgi:hypothetical protein
MASHYLHLLLLFLTKKIHDLAWAISIITGYETFDKSVTYVLLEHMEMYCKGGAVLQEEVGWEDYERTLNTMFYCYCYKNTLFLFLTDKAAPASSIYCNCHLHFPLLSPSGFYS